MYQFVQRIRVSREPDDLVHRMTLLRRIVVTYVHQAIGTHAQRYDGSMYMTVLYSHMEGP
jgi:hypothetical protein